MSDGSLPERLARAITMAGPIPLSQYIAAANAEYYGSRDPLGSAGDFTTAPEISQMFGELIGLWAADLWQRAGQPALAWVELGPGRGTLTADALRAMSSVEFAPPVHFVETSATLRQRQQAAVPDATWHDDVATLPDDCPLIVVANEFFDALPIRQLVRAGDAWRERMVACQDTLFLPITGKDVPESIIPDNLRDAAPGSVIETSPASVGITRAIAGRLARQGGAALVIDYGYEGPVIGDTLQAVSGHRFANPFEQPGNRDLTAHVDFATLGAAAAAEGVRVARPIGQGAFLTALGIDPRAAALTTASPDRADALAADRARLCDAEEMGELFKAMAWTAPNWPEPAGFA
jgi:NADH dehydrogenase [ubiquinone] 1 alpha subcomplex assembly factor 7